MYCPKCGAKTPNDASFCTNCGAKLTEQPFQGQNAFEAGQNNQTNPFTWQDNTQQPTEYSDKSKLAAGLLGIFLGVLGIHNFYLGYTGKAVAQLILGIFCLWTVSGIWGLVEGVMILTGSIDRDAQGRILKD